MNTYEAWSSGRPILSRLPGINGGYSENAVAEWLTDYPDRILLETKFNAIDDIPRQLEPLNCDEDWLDYLAILYGFYGDYWDRNWKADSKRILLYRAYDFIWPNKGSKEVLSYVLSALEIRHLIVQANSFIIGIGQVGDPLGYNAWEYDIYLPSEYFDKPEEFLTRKINDLYGPCWCRSRVLFNDEFFNTYNILATEDGNLLSFGNNNLLAI